MRNTPKGWTATHAALLAVASAGVTSKEAGEWFGVSTHKASNVRLRLLGTGLGSMTMRPFTEDDDQVIRDRFPNSLTTEVQVLIGRTANTIEKRARALGVKKDPAYLVSIGAGHLLLPPELREIMNISKKLKKELKNAKRRSPT